MQQLVAAPASSPLSRPSARSEPVRVFDEDPDLLDGTSPAVAERLRRDVLVPCVALGPGAWRPPEQPPGALGLLVLDGLLTGSVQIDGRWHPDLVGPGDLIRPWDAVDDPMIETVPRWRALRRTRLAVLDARFSAVAARSPELVSILLARAIEHSRLLAAHLAIVHTARAERRMLLLLWHLAERWGRVRRDGVHLPLRLTHRLLAELACVHRPTATTALGALAVDGRVVRCPDGTWLLLGGPPGREVPCDAAA